MNDIPIKDVPGDPQEVWTFPDKPKDRTLKTTLCPLNEFLSLRARLGSGSPLFPRGPHLDKHYQTLLQDPIMQKVKDDYTYNPFSMEPDSVLFLKEMIAMFKPQVVVELGSGISTPILSAQQKEQYKDSDIKPTYVTIDQSDDYLDQTMTLVKKAGTDDTVKPLIFPMCYYKVDTASHHGHDQLGCYDFDEKALHEACGGIRPDMIIIDGPTGGGQNGYIFARLLTVPILSKIAAPECVYFLDDTYRDTEIVAMQDWHQSLLINVLGVKMCGKGTMVATSRKS